MSAHTTLAPGRLGVLGALVIASFFVSVVAASAALSMLGGASVWEFLEVLGSALMWHGESGRLIAVCCAFVVLTQGAFLLPTFSPLTRGGSQRSLRWTATAAAGMIAAFTAAWLWALATTLTLYIPDGAPGDLVIIMIVPLCGAFVASWLYWGAVFFRCATSSSRPEFRLMRMVFGATGVLVAATIPLDVLTRRKTQCYCGAGSLVALCWGLGGAFWLLGPWLLRHRITRMRRDLSGGYCMRCGHARGPSPSQVCSECGHCSVTPKSQRTAG